jgi:hypothetical protein
MSTETSERYAALADEEALSENTLGLQEPGFNVEVLDNLDAPSRSLR